VLLLAGKGELENEIKSYADRYGIMDKVRFLGQRNDIPELMNAADILVMPSVYEGLPVTLVEAQATGLKCAVSDVITRETEITDNIQYISLEKDAGYWAEKILGFTDRAERKSYTDDVAENGYDIYTTVKWLMDFYLEQGGEK
ncbi:MAG: glycosyltransferase, partial [Oscillospiraceae bacterium]|nr:glycosyltransferase [Oscillospiraceae bacterium]